MCSRLFYVILIPYIYAVRDHFSKYNDISFPLSLRREAASEIKSMFDFGFDSYMKYAFPHDELKPKTGLYTDSLPELGNAKNTNKLYRGLSLTLIDSLDSLLLFNRTDAFIEAHQYLSTAIHKTHTNDTRKHIFPGFDIDIRVHVFETNIRILGGLLSAHSLSTHPKWKKLFFSSYPSFNYQNEFLILAQDLGDRLLHAFNTSNMIPFAWINLKHGVLKGETRETCTAGVGTLVLEMSLLSYFTRNPEYFYVAHRALLKLWKLRNVDNNLLGNSLNGATLRWMNKNGGIGAGIDSFYEYLMKSYIYLGYSHYWDIFQISYKSINKYLRRGPWYIETNIATSKASHFHFNSLQSFWPSIQILIGDIPLSLATINSFFSIWYSYHGLPERFLLNSNEPHSTENQYPLRPELIESIFYAYCSIKNNAEFKNSDYYLWLGLEILNDIQNRSKTQFGYTILNNVISGEKGDYMPSYFLAETVKYLLLLFDEENVLHSMENEYIFTTEGHIFPFYSDLRVYIEDIIDSNQDILDLEDHLMMPYTRYEEEEEEDEDGIENENEIELSDDEDEDDEDVNKTAKKESKNKTKNKRIIKEYNAQSIIDSVGIESIFVFQDSYFAICPSSPFYVYSTMHSDDGSGATGTTHVDMDVDVNSDDGMGYHWDWIHKMFGAKHEIYRDKQIAAITSSQCPLRMPSETRSTKRKRRRKESNEWELSARNRVRISHDIGHFTVNFVDHSEKLEISNLGTNWIEITNSVAMNGSHSSFYPFYEVLNGLNMAIATPYSALNDVSIGYLFDSVGPTKYEITLKSRDTIACYQYTMYKLLSDDGMHDDDIHIDIDMGGITSVAASSAYFSSLPIAVSRTELSRDENECSLRRVVASGVLISASSPSTSCQFPDNLAQIIESNTNTKHKYIVLMDRGECTFYEKVNLYSSYTSFIAGIIVGNVVATSNGNIFTMGSDQTQQTLDLPALMLNKLSYHALTHCAKVNNNMMIEFVEILTRCEEQSPTNLNVHGTNSHFFVSSKSNSGFVVTQNHDKFRLSIPQ